MNDYTARQIRTARKEHRCSEYLCRTPIMPGEQYERVVWAPHRCEAMDVDHWLTWRSHAPRFGPQGQFLWGCDVAAAYRENEQWDESVVYGRQDFSR